MNDERLHHSRESSRRHRRSDLVPLRETFHEAARDVPALRLAIIEMLAVRGCRFRGPTQTRIGRSVRYHPEDVARWLAGRRAARGPRAGDAR